MKVGGSEIVPPWRIEAGCPPPPLPRTPETAPRPPLEGQGPVRGDQRMSGAAELGGHDGARAGRPAGRLRHDEYERAHLIDALEAVRTEDDLAGVVSQLREVREDLARAEPEPAPPGDAERRRARRLRPPEHQVVDAVVRGVRRIRQVVPAPRGRVPLDLWVAGS